ncbi:PaaI family thioesterase [Oricola thermophila]|uniref:PaaI family thioesterase n=1 Tax=Oricola thermophila TaxID=2742145 RepID=A0A6N1VGZ3_9HYPH|nr:PaaI family thioesterase [Oricola thermophila]QKV20170.1 PaaI family thioesterase [Oricola thermophila]
MSDVFSRFPPPPSARLLGWELVSERPDIGEIEIAFNPDERMINPHGTVQGGFIAAMLDEAMGPALLSMTKGAFAASTLDLTVSYIRPVSPGRVIAKGRVIRHGRSVAYLEAELYEPGGRLLARATSTALPVTIDPDAA